jgi:hypothetical protein
MPKRRREPSAPPELEVDETVGLAAVQARLLEDRAKLLKELGLEAVAAAPRPPPPARRRPGAAASAAASTAAPERTSLRVRGSKAELGGLEGGVPSLEAGEGPPKAARGQPPAASAAGAASGVQSLAGGAAGPLGAIVRATVDRDCAIKAFVEGALGIVPYVAGRGYHELKEGLQLSIYTTEHILESPEGRLYRGGEQARKACGVAATVHKAQQGPAQGLPEGWALYLRSKSYARKLKAGQRFIYEVG